MKQQQQQQIDPTFGSVMFNELMMQVLCLSQPLLKARELGMQIGGMLGGSNALVVDEGEVDLQGLLAGLLWKGGR